MQVASLELCRILFGLSGWEADRVWSMHPIDFEQGLMDGMVIEGRRLKVPKTPTVCLRMGQPELAPAYDLGYLLRKLPKELHNKENNYWYGLEIEAEPDGTWSATYEHDDSDLHYNNADTPENAAAKLAIELFKNGVLTKGVI